MQNYYKYPISIDHLSQAGILAPDLWKGAFVQFLEIKGILHSLLQRVTFFLPPSTIPEGGRKL